MKFYHSAATIIIYFSFTLIWMTLFINASKDEKKAIIPEFRIALTQELQRDTNILQEKKENSTEPHLYEKRAKVFEQKWKIFCTLLLQKHQLKQNTLSQQSPVNAIGNLNSINKKILSKILNEFLAIYDILILRQTCLALKILVLPNDKDMVMFCKDFGSKEMDNDVPLIWCDLKYFLKQSYYSAFDQMKMFNTEENQYAVLARAHEEKIIVWNNNLTPYSQILFHQATKNASFTNQQNSYSSNQIESSKIFNKGENAWCDITKEGNLATGGDEQDGGDSRIQLQKVKTIVSNFKAFAALLGDGNVVAWGDENHGGKIPDNLQTQLHQNVKMIFSTGDAFAALSNDGSVVAWGHVHHGGKIPFDIQHQLHNVKMIFSTDSSFAALLKDGSVLAWGDKNYGGKIPSDIQTKLKTVKIMISTIGAFAVLLDDGSVLAWGRYLDGGKIPDNIHHQLQQNVEMIFSTNYAFSALLNDGSILSWGNPERGGKIPDNITPQLSQNVKMVIPKERKFTAICKNGKMFTWGEN